MLLERNIIIYIIEFPEHEEAVRDEERRQYDGYSAYHQDHPSWPYFFQEKETVYSQEEDNPPNKGGYRGSHEGEGTGIEEGMGWLRENDGQEKQRDDSRGTTQC